MLESERFASIGTCQTCRYWRHFTEDEDILHYGLHSGTCLNSSFRQGVIPPLDGISYDREDAGGQLSTGKDFGCVHWDNEVRP